MTIIYGDNGSGKSGYSRVLKRACRARDQMEAIHPNAALPASQTGKAESVFEIKIDGSAQDEHWTDGKAAPAALSSFAIFDSHCARAYLDSEDDFSYVPYGLDVFSVISRMLRENHQKPSLTHCFLIFSIRYRHVPNSRAERVPKEYSNAKNPHRITPAF